MHTKVVIINLKDTNNKSYIGTFTPWVSIDNSLVYIGIGLNWLKFKKFNIFLIYKATKCRIKIQKSF